MNLLQHQRRIKYMVALRRSQHIFPTENLRFDIRIFPYHGLDLFTNSYRFIEKYGPAFFQIGQEKFRAPRSICLSQWKDSLTADIAD